MPKQKKKLIETHGKVEDFDQPQTATAKRQPLTLEEVWGGINELERYGTKDKKVYELQLRDMSRADLESHARKLGVVVVESSRLRDKLLHEFDVYTASLQDPAKLVTGSVIRNGSKTKAPSEEIRKILAEGR